MANKKPATHVGVTKPDMTTGNKVEPTTKAKPAPSAIPGTNKKKKKGK